MGATSESASTDQVDSLLHQLSFEEKCSLLGGRDRWHLPGFKRLGVPPVRFSDSGTACRGVFAFNGVPAWQTLCTTALAATWDDKLAHQIGHLIGLDSMAKQVHVIYGPQVNIPRGPLAGRSFECFGEDPHLAGKMAAAWIRGLQSTGVQACVKHYVGNDQEDQRYSTDNVIPERALREIYLRPFEIVVRESNPGCIMVSYGLVNGIPAVAHRQLLHDVLREEWLYEGVTISDYFATSSVAGTIKAGLDVEMPGPPIMRGDALQRAVMAGLVKTRDIDISARRVLKLALKAKAMEYAVDIDMGIYKDPSVSALLRQAAERAIVLLKNEHSMLPLSLENLRNKHIAVIGPNAMSHVSGGGGSAMCTTPYVVSALEGIKRLAEPAGIRVSAEPGCRISTTLGDLAPYVRVPNTEEQGLLVDFYNEDPWKDPASTMQPIYSTTTTDSRIILIDHIPTEVTANFVPTRSGAWQFGLILCGQGNVYIDGHLVVENSTNQTLGDAFACAGSVEETGTLKMEEGRQYAYELRFHYGKQVGNSTLTMGCGGIELTAAPQIGSEEGLVAAERLAREADVVLLIAGHPKEYEAEGFDRNHMDLCGHTNELIRRVLAANSSTAIVLQTATPVTMPWISEASSILQAWYGGVEFGNAIASLVFGLCNPSGKLPLSFPKRLEDTPTALHWGDDLGTTQYSEGIFVGYRYYDAKKTEPLFPFGHGLSYTAFDYRKMELIQGEEASLDIQVSAEVHNVGNIHGTEVVQIYCSAPRHGPRKAEKALAAYLAVDVKAGTNTSFGVTLDRHSYAYWDVQNACWTVAAGTYLVTVASSSRDDRLKGSFVISRPVSWRSGITKV